MSKRLSELTEHDGSGVSKKLKRDERRSDGNGATLASGSLSELMPSNVMRDDRCDDAIGVLSNTGRYNNTVIRAQHFNAPGSTFNHVDGVQQNIVNVNVNHTVVDESSESKHDRILRWLSPRIPSTNYYQALKICHSNTGQWLIEDKRFLEWKANSTSLLWLHGKPGCGKTVLSSVVIKNISEYCDCTAEEAYAYFFFDGRDSQTGLQRHEQLIRSLIWQFFEQAHRIPEAIEALYNRCGSGARQPSVESLQATLLLVLSQFHQAYLIVDALDECTDRSELLDWIKEITCWKDGRLHVLATSREDVDIKIGLMKLSPVTVRLGDDSVNGDIATYLDSKLLPDLERKTWRDHVDTRNEVKTSLMKRAQGMFRWVALQLEVLRDCQSRHHVKTQLAQLPKDLDETYDRILGQIQEKNHEDAVKLFKWLAFSVRPLKLSELAEVVQIDLESRDLPWFDTERRYDDTEDILRVCSGFVSVTDDGEVKLAHLSVKEYMLSCWPPKFRISEATSHSLISKTCLAYLSQFDRQGYWTPDRFLLVHHPLAQYAAEHWVYHGLCGDVESEVQHQQLALNVFRHDHIFLNWIKIRDGHVLQSEVGQPLYYASEAGLRDVVRVLLADGVDASAQGGLYGSALQAASSRGHETIVKLLLENSVDVNAQGGWYGSALQAASSGGHETIVKMLLENGANVNAHEGEYYSAIQVSSSGGHEAIVRMLLENGATVNTQGEDSSALQLASSEGHEPIVKMLLESGANVNAQEGEYYSALQAASSGGHEAIVKILLDNGANVDAQGEDGTALQVASSEGHEAIVKLLLESGAHVNAQEGEYCSALQMASSEGHETIVKMLLDHGAEVNAQEGEYYSALQVASSEGHEAIVQLLLDHGADVNAQGGEFGSALLAASSQGHDVIARILLEHGAHVNAQGEDGSALHVASLEGHEAIVEILLNRGADVNAQGGRYGTAFKAASSGGHKAIVMMLLKNGANANALGEDSDEV